ncbi:MAG: insulinase family protein [Alphaproteobacteria bacterium]|nr:insulinase family protein [Alphaproteobacteria bacterium]MCB9793417.1 insulinase family protein [Alphaproteobacteria bacterium]
MIPLFLVLAAMPQARALEIPHEHYELDNGLDVILLEDHSLPQVVINLWYDVGAGVEPAGRTGFAHLFEHLMFMGTTRLPDSGFDDLMEAHGGWNNAWTSEDATDYYEVGPPELLGTFLWMEADRMEGLPGAMTQAKLDLQRDVVRNERRQSYEDAPYGVGWLAIPEAMYPEGHPYAHPVIGSHEDLEAATVEDVVDFFRTWYHPANASLVVAGDFDPAEIKPLIERTFGHLSPQELPKREQPAPPDLPITPLIELEDQVGIPATMMLWHSPGAMQPGDAEMDILATILADGRSSRLYDRLVRAEGAALEVSAYQMSQSLTSLFAIDAKPTEGHDLPEIEALIMEELTRLATEGPTPEEMERARNHYEMSTLRQLESLQARASALNRYNVNVGRPDYLAEDLARYSEATPEGVMKAAASLSEARRCVIRVTPAASEEAPE